MSIKLEFDKKRERKYNGNGFQKISKAYIESDSDDDYNGGFIDLGSLISNASNFVTNNKDAIQAIASTVGKVAELGKSVSDTVKSSKELGAIELKTLSKAQKTRKKVKTLTPEQDKILMGNGFVRFHSRANT